MDQMYVKKPELMTQEEKRNRLRKKWNLKEKKSGVRIGYTRG